MESSTVLGLGFTFAVLVGVGIVVMSTAHNRRHIDGVMAVLRQRFAQGSVTPYQAACFTSVPAVEVAVWLLLERGDVLVSREGRVSRAHAGESAASIGRDKDEPDAGGRGPHDEVQAAVLTALASAPGGLKLHEIAAHPACARASVRAQDLGIPDLHYLGIGSVTALKALQWIQAQSEHLLAARFVALDHDRERRAVALFRARTPMHFPPGTPRHIVDFARNRSERGADASFLMLTSSSAGAAGVSSCSGGVSCGSGGASCGGGGGGAGCGGGGGGAC